MNEWRQTRGVDVSNQEMLWMVGSPTPQRPPPKKSGQHQGLRVQTGFLREEKCSEPKWAQNSEESSPKYLFKQNSVGTAEDKCEQSQGGTKEVLKNQ